MAIDLTALKAKIAAQKAAQAAQEKPKDETNKNTSALVVQSSNVPSTSSSVSTSDNGSTDNNSPVPTVSAPSQLGTAKTTEIDHIDFISKMNSLAEAIHKQHPTMPVLLRQIHTQLRNDPELVTTLDEDAIGIIVRGLQIQTKTELVAEVVKKTSSGRSKKVPALSVDML